jgi:hypothetical protein
MEAREEKAMPWRRSLLPAVLLVSACGGRSLALLDAGRSFDRSGPTPEPPRPDLGACPGLGLFAGGKRIASTPASAALFRSDSSHVVLVTKSLDLLRVALPSTSTTKLLGGVRSVAWLVADEELLVATSADAATPYQLAILRLDGASSTTLGTAVCAHRAAADGSRVYLIDGCPAKTSVGVLKVFDRKTGTTQTIAKEISALGGLALSPDGKRVAFLSQLDSAGDCLKDTGILEEWGPSGARGFLGAVVAQSLEYLPSGRLLHQLRPPCGSPAGDLLRLLPLEGESVALGSGFFGYIATAETAPRYAASADEAIVIGTDHLSVASSGKLPLRAVRTDGSGAAVLATDLYPLHQISAAYQAWRFTADRRTLLFTPIHKPPPMPEMGLAALAAPGWTRIPLSSSLASLNWSEAPSGDAVAFYEGPPGVGSAKQLRLVTLSTGKGTTLATPQDPGWPFSARPRFLPDGRGLLYIDRPSNSLTVLRYVSVAGGPPTEVGRWSGEIFLPPTSAVVDPTACLALHDTDLGPEPGTWLSLLPR